MSLASACTVLFPVPGRVIKRLRASKQAGGRQPEPSSHAAAMPSQMQLAFSVSLRWLCSRNKACHTRCLLLPLRVQQQTDSPHKLCIALTVCALNGVAPLYMCGLTVLAFPSCAPEAHASAPWLVNSSLTLLLLQPPDGGCLQPLVWVCCTGQTCHSSATWRSAVWP